VLIANSLAVVCLHSALQSVPTCSYNCLGYVQCPGDSCTYANFNCVLIGDLTDTNDEVRWYSLGQHDVMLGAKKPQKDAVLECRIPCDASMMPAAMKRQVEPYRDCDGVHLVDICRLTMGNCVHYT
jgi:hypothetical protein